MSSSKIYDSKMPDFFFYLGTELYAVGTLELRKHKYTLKSKPY